MTTALLLQLGIDSCLALSRTQHVVPTPAREILGLVRPDRRSASSSIWHILGPHGPVFVYGDIEICLAENYRCGVPFG